MIKVLLLSAGFGDGHRQVAKALRESFTNRGVRVFEIDCFEQTNPRLAKLNQWLYEATTRHCPWLYGLSYRMTANLRPNHILWKLLSLFSRKAYVQALNEYEPDVVLQLFPDYGVEAVPPNTEKPLIGVVITDFSVHSHWFHPNVDVYFIPHASMQTDMEPFISSQTEIIESGIPIRDQFHRKSRVSVERPYVLFATGGRGLFPDLEDVIKTILTNLPTFDVYVLCGRNEAMLQRINKLASECTRLHALPYVENVADWFHGASLAVVKAGGVTVSECLAAQCPMIFYRPQPGQEADNAAVLESMGAGKVVRDRKELDALLCNRSMMHEVMHMKNVCASLAHPDASEIIADYVLDRVSKRGRQLLRRQVQSLF
jgi:processive 1,2-diacylglycerol beta-glucosyltransferase